MLRRGDGPNCEDSKRLKRTLEDLERELLSDDSDLASSVFDAELPAISEPPERDWTDVIEDLLSADSCSFPTQTIESTSSILVDQSSVVRSTSKVDRSSSEATVQRLGVSQQQASPAQSVHLSSDAAGQLKELLLSCATAIDVEDFQLAINILDSLKKSVSKCGDPVQRLGAHMVDALAARIESMSGGQGKASKFQEPSAAEVFPATQPATQVLYRACPYFKFGFLAANGAIAEAFSGERRVHIVDFEIGQGRQWESLIETFSRRPGGPPHVRLTGVDDPKSATSRVGGFEGVGRRLREIAQNNGVSFEFNQVTMEASQVQRWMLEKKPGEALAVNFAFQLHHMPDESVSTTNPRDRLLRMVRGMEPKIVTLVEHEANTNTAPFYPRFVEALNYYTAMFDSLDASLLRESGDRLNAEHCLAREIVNIVSCERSERFERYELAGKWRARMTMAGFRACPLSSGISKTIKELLQDYSHNYKLREESGALYLDWLDRGLVVASAWQ